MKLDTDRIADAKNGSGSVVSAVKQIFSSHS